MPLPVHQIRLTQLVTLRRTFEQDLGPLLDVGRVHPVGSLTRHIWTSPYVGVTLVFEGGYV